MGRPETKVGSEFSGDLYYKLAGIAFVNIPDPVWPLTSWPMRDGGE